MADGLVHTLKMSGYNVFSSGTGAYADQLLLAQDFDLIVLDLCLPDVDGLDLLRRIRQRKMQLPVLILTARDRMNDKIRGINEGADDYMSKPFELKELEVRIHALIRRCYGGFQKDIAFGPLSLNTADNRIVAEGKPIPLSPREYAVLELLLLQAGKVVCKDRLAQRLASDSDALSDNAIEIYIHRVRKRIEPYGVLIKTLRGLGYTLELAHA